MKRGSDSVRSNSICAFEPRERRRNQATATPSISIFQAGLARPPTIRVLAVLTLPWARPSPYSHQSGAHIAAAMDKLDGRYRTDKKPA